MITLLTMLGLSCPSMNIINKTKVWNVIDKEVLSIAIKRCGELYKNSPCLKKFIKVEENVYRVICSKEISK